MSTVPQLRPQDVQTQDVLSQDAWWNLFDQLRLAQQAAYQECGGPIAFFHNERNVDTEKT